MSKNNENPQNCEHKWTIYEMADHDEVMVGNTIGVSFDLICRACGAAAVSKDQKATIKVESIDLSFCEANAP